MVQKWQKWAVHLPAKHVKEIFYFAQECVTISKEAVLKCGLLVKMNNFP
jgi:hypothetical protein